MDIKNVEAYLMINGKYFEPSVLPIIRDRLERLDESKAISLYSLELKDPTLLLVISLFFGALGVDRFMLGDIGIGVLKLLTGGVCGILTIIDWFTTMKRTREDNFKKIMMYI